MRVAYSQIFDNKEISDIKEIWVQEDTKLTQAK